MAFARSRCSKWDRVFGLAIIAGGAVFLIVGLSGTGAPIEHLSNAFSAYRHETILYILGGTSAVFAGLVVVFARPMQ